MDFNFRKKMIDDLFESVGQTIGIRVFVIIFERALWKTELKYDEANLIRVSEDGVDVQELSKIEPDRAILVLTEFLNNIIDTLVQLVGKEVVKQLTQVRANFIVEDVAV
ncbi:hypothetical protein JT05_13490 [Desulfosporosinus sp. Tol-M]|nr:hypothetical protein JT05_13490 [Desulfosporosinus sp. Tol-M]